MTDSVVTVAGAVLKNGRYGDLPLTAHFLYTPRDPMAVTMTLILEVELACGDVAATQTTWVFARDIIDTALSRLSAVPVGHGDVTAMYLVDADLLRITLTDVEGVRHPVYVDAAPLYTFMEESLKATPAHEESMDVDDAIAQILDQSRKAG